MLVYTVWYENEMGSALWGIHDSKEKAEAAVVKILSEGYGENVWYNKEEVL